MRTGLVMAPRMPVLRAGHFVQVFQQFGCVLQNARTVRLLDAGLPLKRLQLYFDLGVVRLHLLHHRLHLCSRRAGQHIQMFLMITLHLIEAAPDLGDHIAGEVAINGGRLFGVLAKRFGKDRHALVEGHRERLVWWR